MSKHSHPVNYNKIHSYSNCRTPTKAKQPSCCTISSSAPKYDPENQFGAPNIDNQADPAVCVRFAIAKAVVSHLFKRSIDVSQDNIMILLVQRMYENKSLDGVDPMIYNNTEIILQDLVNEVGIRENRNWWKV